MKKEFIKYSIKGIQLFLFFLILYVFYRSEFYWEGAKRSYYIKYYIILLSLFLSTILLNLFSYNFKQNILTISFSILFSCYLIEGIFYFIDLENYLNIEKRLFVSEVKKSKKVFDWRTTYQFYKDSKKENEDIVITIKPSHYLNKSKNLFPLTGISDRETVYCNENGYWVKFNSDKFGLRNKNQDWNTQNNFFLIGDSFGMGACVNDDDTIKANLEKFYGEGSVIDLSYNGRGPLQQYAIMREYLEYLNPKLVLWLYYEENDLLNLSNEITDNLLNNYLVNDNFSQNIFYRQKEADKLNLQTLENEISFRKKLHYKKFFKFLKLSNLRDITLENFFGKNESVEEVDYSNQLENFKEIIIKAKRLAEQNNSEFLFVYLPSAYEYLPDKIKDRAYNLIKDYPDIINILRDNAIKYYDFKAEIDKNYDDPLSLYAFRSHSHFNPKGYEILTNNIIKFVNSNYIAFSK